MFKLRLKQLWNYIKMIIYPIVSKAIKAMLIAAKEETKHEINSLKQKSANIITKKKVK